MDEDLSWFDLKLFVFPALSCIAGVVVLRALRIGKLMDVKGVKLEEIKKIVLEYCTNLGQEAQEERGEVISYLRAMLTRCL